MLQSPSHPNLAMSKLDEGPDVQSFLSVSHLEAELCQQHRVAIKQRCCSASEN